MAFPRPQKWKSSAGACPQTPQTPGIFGACFPWASRAYQDGKTTLRPWVRFQIGRVGKFWRRARASSRTSSPNILQNSSDIFEYLIGQCSMTEGNFQHCRHKQVFKSRGSSSQHYSSLFISMTVTSNSWHHSCPFCEKKKLNQVENGVKELCLDGFCITVTYFYGNWIDWLSIIIHLNKQREGIDFDLIFYVNTQGGCKKNMKTLLTPLR